MVFSVFTQPVVLFSDSRKSNCFGPNPTAQGAGQAELEPQSRGLVLPGPWGPRLPASSWDVGLAPPICWCHCMGLGQQDWVLRGFFLSIRPKSQP